MFEKQTLGRAILRATFVSCFLLMGLSCSNNKGDPEESTDLGPVPPSVELEILSPLKAQPNVKVPENDPAYAAVEILDDRLIFQFTDAPKVDLQVDDVVVGSFDSGYLRHVASVGELKDGEWEIETRPATLEDLIADGHFRVTIEGFGSDWLEGDAMIGGRRSYLGEENKFTILAPELIPGIQCGVFNSSSVSLEPTIDVTSRTVMDFKLTDGLGLQSALIQIGGTADISLTFENTSTTAAGQCSIDFIEDYRAAFANPDLLKFKLRPITIPLAPLPFPLVITSAIEPVAVLDLKLSALDEKSVTTHNLTVGFALGAQYDGSKWGPVWDPVLDGSSTARQSAEQTNAVGETTIEAEMSAGLKASAFVYDTAGPTLALTASLKGSATFDAQLCSYETSLSAALKGAVGAEIQIPIVDSTLVEYSKEETFAEIVIYEGGGTLSCDMEIPDAGMPPNNDVGPDTGTSGILYTYYSSGNAGVYYVATPQGAPELFAGSAATASWSPNGAWVVATQKVSSLADRTILMDSLGDQRQEVSTGGQAGDRLPQWSPDGSSIMFVRLGPGSSNPDEIWVTDITGNERFVTNGSVFSTTAVWTSQGRIVFTAQRDNCVLFSVDPSNGSETCLAASDQVFCAEALSSDGMTAYAEARSDAGAPSGACVLDGLYNFASAGGPTKVGGFSDTLKFRVLSWSDAGALVRFWDPSDINDIPDIGMLNGGAPTTLIPDVSAASAMFDPNGGGFLYADPDGLYYSTGGAGTVVDDRAGGYVFTPGGWR